MNVYEFLQHPDPNIYFDAGEDILTVDLETTNKEHGDSLVEENDIVRTGMKWITRPPHSFAGDYLSEDVGRLVDTIEKAEVLVGHNIKFDLRWLARAGLDLTKVLVWDTMLAEKVLLGNNPGNKPLGLGAVAERYGFSGKEPIVDKLMKNGVCPSEMPTSLVKRRVEYDVSVTEEIFLKQREIAREKGKLGVILTRCILTPVLADIEANGMCLSKERVLEAWAEVSEEYVDVQAQLKKIADINWNSPKQKAELLYEKFKFKELKDRRGNVLKTPGGDPKTDVDTIKLLKATTKRQKALKALLEEQSVLNAKLTKALDKFKACVENDDLLYAQFNQHITRTHRLSSNGTFYKIQLQNLARVFKPLFTTRHEGWEFCEADGSNLEFRVAVELGEDENGRRDIADDDFDAHEYTAATLTEAGQPTDRQGAKAHTFKPLYGGSSGTDAERAYYDAFKLRYSGVADVQQRWKDEAFREKSVTLPWGMEFYFPHTKFTRTGYQTDSTQICNYPVQSFATAEIIPIAVTYLWHEMKQLGLRALLVNTVHDSVEIEAPTEEKEKLNEIIVRSFTESCYNYLMDVYKFNFKTPLGVGLKWGKYWGEGKELKFTVENKIG